jgi:exodeoxyribonuclease-3
MKIATFNVNGVNGRLPVLLRWLAEAKPDVACLQELKAPQDKFPEAAIRDAGYRAVWHGQKSWNGVAILARAAEPVETRRGLPGDPDDSHSRYIEAAVDVGCLYLPNGNPAPGPRFDYKLRWLERLALHASEMMAHEMPVVLAGDYNVIPTDVDVYKPERWLDDALFRPEVRAAFHGLTAQGWTDALRALPPDARIYTFWDYYAWTRDAVLHHYLRFGRIATACRADVDRSAAGKRPAPCTTWIDFDRRKGFRRSQPINRYDARNPRPLDQARTCCSVATGMGVIIGPEAVAVNPFADERSRAGRGASSPHDAWALYLYSMV